MSGSTAAAGSGRAIEKKRDKILRRTARKLKRIWTVGIPDRLARELLFRRAATVITGSNEEKRRLIEQGFSGEVRVIYHFARKPLPSADRNGIRIKLGLRGVVLTCLGWIHARKGIDVAMRALAQLPTEYCLVVAGGSTARASGHERHLHQLASELKVSDRVRFTGALTEEGYRDYLTATDIGICAFRDVSSSGSLTDWVGSGTPVVASNLELIKEYNSIVPRSIAVFEPGNSESLARSIEAVCANMTACARRVCSLSESLSIGRSAEEHVEIYKSAVSS